MKLIACKATTVFQLSAGESDLLVPTVTGIFGGAAGWVVKASQIQDCQVSMTVPSGVDPLYAGYMNIKNGIVVKKVTTNSTFTGTIGGVAVTADDLNGVTGGSGTYSGTVDIEIQ